MSVAYQSRLIPRVLEFWAERELPADRLEECLLSVFSDVATALGQVLFARMPESMNPGSGSGAADGMDSGGAGHRARVGKGKIPLFSWRLFSKLVTHGIELLQ